MEGNWKSRHPLKGPVHKFPYLQELPWALTERQQLGKYQSHAGKDGLYDFRAKAGGTATIVLLLRLHPVQTTGGPHLACGEPSPNRANAESAFAW